MRAERVGTYAKQKRRAAKGPGDAVRWLDDPRRARRVNLAGFVRLFSRCNECNHPLRAARKADLSERVPPHAFAAHGSFLECPSCRRVYWERSHT